MKASRRQQLRTNELAQSLAEAIEFIKANSGTVVVGVAAVVLVVALVVYWYSASVAVTQRGWSDLFGSQLEPSPEARLSKLRAVATSYKEPQLAALAWLTYGDGAYQQARSAAQPADQQRMFGEALKAYQTVIDQYPDELLAAAGARFKLASLAEDRRRWDDARMYYQAIIDDNRLATYPQAAMAKEALARLDAISEQVVFAGPPTTAPVALTRPAAASRPSVKIPAPKSAAKGSPATKPTTTSAK